MLRVLLPLCLLTHAVGDDGLPPSLKKMLDLAQNDPDALMAEIEQSPFRAVVSEVPLSGVPSAREGASLPTVTAHGMGDSCFNRGFKSVTTAISKRTATYAVCIPGGSNRITDTINAFLMNMDKSVDLFAGKIRADPKLQNGFNAIGFSQGNSLIRGYIQKYNDPPVNSFVSVHGTVMGVSSLPHCFRQGKPLGLICRSVSEVLGDVAYSKLVQDVLFQADYLRIPTKFDKASFLRNSQIAGWNNDDPTRVNNTYAINFGKTKHFAMVKAMKDSMVYPNEGEWWGSEPDGAYGTALSMKDTKYYKQDLFGLKTADEAGKISFESTAGDHLQFTDAELNAWIDKYLIGQRAPDDLKFQSIPNLKKIIDLADSDPDALMAEIEQSPLRAVVPEIEMPDAGAPEGTALPTVTAHGMGDSCFNPISMKSVTRAIAKKTGSYAVCIPGGGNFITDTINAFLMDMDKSVDLFAEKIRADPQLKGGFNAIGFSQGNSLIRGYIQKYNDPPVNAFISVHGTVMGVASLPHCFKQGKPLGLICRAVAEVLGDLAYNKFVQHHLFQADYLRIATKATKSAFLRNSQIAGWNNENPDRFNKTYQVNFAKTKRFAMVKALKDTMVYPNEGEWWGSLPDGNYSDAISMKDTKYYQQDMFGLKTADEASKISFESTPGDHLKFTKDELYGWIDKYFLGQDRAVVV